MEAFAEEDLEELSSSGLTHEEKMKDLFYAKAWNDRKKYEEKAKKKADFDEIAHDQWGDSKGRPHTPGIDLLGKKSWEDAPDLYGRFKGIPPPYSLKEDGSVAVWSGEEPRRGVANEKRMPRTLITPIQDEKGRELNKALKFHQGRESESPVVMKPMEKHEPVKSPMTVMPNIGIGGRRRKTRRRRKKGRGKRKKTRRIVCNKRKLTRRK